jgi:proline dehydrogenase
MNDKSPLLRKLSGFLASSSWLRKTAVTTPVIREMAWRFIAGEDLNAGLAVVRTLNARGIKGTLNHVGTHVRQEADAVAAADVAIAALHQIQQEQIDSHLSLKLTQIGLDIDEDFCKRQLRRVLDCAAQSDNFVRIDMEESDYTGRTLGIFEEMRQEYGTKHVGIVVQSYLRNVTGDLPRLLAGDSRIRLVKGGYWEPASVVYRSKAEIDQAFQKDIDLLFTHGTNPALATHDPLCIDYALRVAAEVGLGPQDFEFQMLYGVRTDLQDRLVREGYTVRCYVPWGSQWYSYFLGCARRAAGGILRRPEGWGKPIPQHHASGIHKARA